MRPWTELVHLPEEGLNSLDTAAINLAFAADLPDARRFAPHACLDRVGEMTNRTAQFTAENWPLFRSAPAQFRNSEAYYRALCLVTVLQRDFGVRYNPAKVPTQTRLETPDVFLYGPVLGGGGACVSLPVLYISVGRRLGYPMKLVLAKAGQFFHTFARWDDPQGERFNIEATTPGLNSDPDNAYRTGQYAITPDEEEANFLLKSLSRRQELSVFLEQRAYCWLNHQRRRPAVNAFAWACALFPENRAVRERLELHINRWAATLARRQPPDYPAMYVWWPPRRFPASVPLQVERRILTLEASENILNDRDFDREWWEPLRRGRLPARRPKQVLVRITPESCTVRLTADPAPPGNGAELVAQLGAGLGYCRAQFCGLI